MAKFNLQPIVKRVRTDFAVLAPRVKYFLIDLAEDFWKDGSPPPVSASFVTNLKQASGAASSAAKKTPAYARFEWVALPGEVSEKMWGDGLVMPGDIAFSDILIKSLKLRPDMQVLDISAGLGRRLRQMADELGVIATGLEPDPEIAARGMELSVQAGKGKTAGIATYDPENFSITKKYDCIIAREVFYRGGDKQKLMQAIAACTKPLGQICFTDYILDAENREQPSVKAWQAFENNVEPLGLVEMAEAWAKVGFKLEVHEDQTDLYRREILIGLKRFVMFLNSGIRPDGTSKATIRRRLGTWVQRLQAMEKGLKLYRFYGTKG